MPEISTEAFTLIVTTLVGFVTYYRTLIRVPNPPSELVPPKTYIFPETALGGEISEDIHDSFATDGLSSFAYSKASGSMNFDFFETKQSSQGLVSFYLGDVAGKGLPASLCQSACVSQLKLASSISLDPVGIVSEVNESLSRRGVDGRYATLLYGTLELATGRLKLLSAGHPSPIRISKDDEADMLECTPCLPVGILPDHKYAVTEHILRPGDTLIVYSDGIIEARDGVKNFFGESRLAMIARRFHSSLPKVTVDRIFDCVEAFSGKRKDDQTLLALHFAGLKSEYSTNPLQTVCLA